MKNVLLLGAGKVGSSIARMLSRTGEYLVTVADVDEQALQPLAAQPLVVTQRLDVRNAAELENVMRGNEAVVSACSHDMNPAIAAVALQAGISYFDLTEDVACSARVEKLAGEARADQIFMPQCGLAPGFVGILGRALVGCLDDVWSLKLRVGALPKYPSNRLKYNLTWSTEGLVNEYCCSCEAIRDYRLIHLNALEGLESLSIDGQEYEVFNTSGGLGTLARSLTDTVRELTYKTIRYPAHRDYIDFLINDLRLGEPGRRRELLKEILESAVPGTQQDVVIVWASVGGLIAGRYREIVDLRRIQHGVHYGEEWTAIQLTTSAGLCAVLDLHLTGKLRGRGFVRQEDVSLEQFLENRFGRVFQSGSVPISFGHPASNVRELSPKAVAG